MPMIKSYEKLYIDRIYDTFIDEEQLQACDSTIKKIADSLSPAVFFKAVHQGNGQISC